MTVTSEVMVRDEDLTLPHPLAHLRAFVMIPWLDVDPDATLTVAGAARPVARPARRTRPGERAGVRLTGAVLGVETDRAAADRWADPQA